MTYAGLTTADKGALLDAQSKEYEYLWLNSTARIVNIKNALAQIAEMEKNQVLSEIIDSIENPKPLTWNERINQMTVEEKAKYFVAKKWSGAGSVYIAIDNSIHDRRKQAENRNKKILNSPYTEGETE